MLFLIMVVLGVVLGLFTNGRLAYLLNIKFEKIWLVLIAVCIQYSMNVLSSKGIIDAAKYGIIAQGAAFCILIIALWFNRKYLGVLVLGIGCLSNALVMMLNGGRMPVSHQALLDLGDLRSLELLSKGLDGKHILVSEVTKLTFLADVISMPPVLGWLMPIVSVGDLIAAAGVFLIAYLSVKGRYSEKQDEGLKGINN
ncbi:MAG: DUF5317 domain-containing protein [Bacillota bacterium]|nr:DUF5317 domain-containing protein [Bacillota bacterium]